MQDSRNKIRTFVRENFLFGGDDELHDGDSFLEMGIVDSTGVLELVAFLEDQWGLTIDDSELVPENLDSVDNLVGFLERKLPATVC
ncbi:MAG: acyl carrier protein [Planctomycetaceae bacterium]|jgi:acyl carrier protein|nr:acyl carrier protein [Planctomycetaceae bacterium]